MRVRPPSRPLPPDITDGHLKMGEGGRRRGKVRIVVRALLVCKAELWLADVKSFPFTFEDLLDVTQELFHIILGNVEHDVVDVFSHMNGKAKLSR